MGFQDPGKRPMHSLCEHQKRLCAEMDMQNATMLYTDMLHPDDEPMTEEQIMEQMLDEFLESFWKLLFAIIIVSCTCFLWCFGRIPERLGNAWTRVCALIRSVWASISDCWSAFWAATRPILCVLRDRNQAIQRLESQLQEASQRIESLEGTIEQQRELLNTHRDTHETEKTELQVQLSQKGLDLTAQKFEIARLKRKPE